MSVEDSDTYTSPPGEHTVRGGREWWRWGGKCFNQGAEGHLLWSPWSWHGEEWLKTTTTSDRKESKVKQKQFRIRGTQRGKTGAETRRSEEEKEPGGCGRHWAVKSIFKNDNLQ